MFPIHRWRPRWARGILVAILGLSWLGPLATEAVWGQASAPRIHLLAVADTNDASIGPSVEADLGSVRVLFYANVPQAQLRTTALQGNGVTPEGVLAAVRALKIQSGQDTVVFYYSGHGAFDTQSNDHVLQPARKSLPRRDVRAAIEQLQPRLLVMITDTCSTLVDRPPAVGAPKIEPPRQLPPVFRSLFIDATGLIDISCTKPGETALGDRQGGYFTWILAGYLQDHRQSRLRWPQVLKEVNRLVSLRYDDAKQTAYIVARTGGDVEGPIDSSFPPPPQPPQPPSPRLHFGITADRTGRSARVNGVEVLRVEPNSPATSMRDKAGNQRTLVTGRDIITHVNGNRVTTNAEIVTAVARSPQQMVVRVYDSQIGSTEDYTVNLGEAPRPRRMRFGVMAKQTARSVRVGGVEVTMVVPGYPGTNLRSRADGKQYYLEVGQDFITRINGQPVTTYEQYAKAIDESPRKMVIRVYESRAGKSGDYDVLLRD